MSDLFGNDIVGFPTRRLIFIYLEMFDLHWLKLSPQQPSGYCRLPSVVTCTVGVCYHWRMFVSGLLAIPGKNSVHIHMLTKLTIKYP